QPRVRPLWRWLNGGGRVRRHRRAATHGLRAIDRRGELHRTAHERPRARGRGELGMDEQQRRAEELLEERMRSRKPHGATATEPTPTDVEPSTEDAPTDYKADLQRMAAAFANSQKRKAT